MFLVILPINFSRFRWNKLPKINSGQLIPVINYLFKSENNYLGNFCGLNSTKRIGGSTAHKFPWGQTIIYFPRLEECLEIQNFFPECFQGVSRFSPDFAPGRPNDDVNPVQGRETCCHHVTVARFGLL